MSMVDTEELAHTISARLHTVLGAGSGLAPLESLHREAGTRLGVTHQVTLLVECSLEYARSPGRPVGESLSAWAELCDRAGRHLPDHDTTLMAIRSYHTRYLRHRGQPGDLDRVVRLRREELDRRVRGGVGENWTGVAKADLAIALLERGRYGVFDPHLRRPNPDADLAQARELAEEELRRRATGYGLDHPFAWHARGILANILLALGHRATGAVRTRLAAEALALADALLAYQWQRAGTHTLDALRGQVIRAEALTLLDRDRDAVREARLAGVLARHRSGMDLGRPLIVLACALAVRDRAAGLLAAEQALAARRVGFPPLHHQITEAEWLVSTLAEPVNREQE
jgi:hypothetical protein